MEIEVRMLGMTPYLMHNPKLMDPDYEYTRAIKALTSKRKKTDQDLKEIDDLEWTGGLDWGDVGGKKTLVIPSAKPRKSFIQAGKIHKLGKNVERALKPLEMSAPLLYDGPQKLSDLARLPQFRSRLSVVVNGKRVMRCRPQFLPWGVIVRFMFRPDAGLNFDELARVVELAGQAEGVGDNRTNGYGSSQNHVCEVGGAGYRPVEATVAGLSAFFEALRGKGASGAA